MIFLGMRKIVHGDLASRNVLLKRFSEGFTAKICDFGLALNCDRESEGGTPYARIPNHSEANVCLPIHSTAPEVLENGKFSTRSDVWSFGVVIFEVFGRGKNPFRKIPPRDLLRRLRDGERPLAAHAPPSVRQLAESCLAWDAEHRPTFPVCFRILSDVLDEGGEVETSDSDAIIYQNFV